MGRWRPVHNEVGPFLADTIFAALHLIRPEGEGVRFAADSLVEEDGFEPSVPLTKYVGPSQRIRRFLSRRGEVPLGGMADEYAQVQRHLQAKGLKITTGTIVDTTAPSSTKMPPRRAKGNQWYFGLKAH